MIAPPILLSRLITNIYLNADFMLTMSPFQLWERKISPALSGPAWDAKIYQNGRVRGERGDGLGQQSITCRTLMSLQSSQGQHQHPSIFDWLKNKGSQVPRNSVFGFGHWELVWSSTWTFWWFLVSCITHAAATSRNKKFPTRHSVGWDDTAWQMEILSKNVRNFHKNNFTRFAWKIDLW